ncbi:MAG: Gfo/Idh/MocA family protein, partial [Chloroflexota bacterium]
MLTCDNQQERAKYALLSICFEYHYWDEARFLRQRLRAGDLGHVHFVRTWGGAVGGFPADNARYHVARAGGGVLAHWTIHNLDLALWLLGNPEPLTASAFSERRLGRLLGSGDPPPPGFAAGTPEVEDFAGGLVRLQGGAALTVEANWLQPPSPRPEGWELLGERGAASISPLRLLRDRGGTWVDETPTPGTLAPCDYDLRRLMAGFLHSVQEDGPSPVSGP